MLTPQIQIFHSTSDSPIRTGTQDIFNPIGPAGHQWISNAEKLKTSINDFFAEKRGPRPSFSKGVICKVTSDPMFDVNSRWGMNSGSNAVVTPNPKFVNFGITSVNTTEKLGFVSVPTTRVGRPTKIPDCLRQGHDIEEATADTVSETKADSNYKKMILKLWENSRFWEGKYFYEYYATDTNNGFERAFHHFTTVKWKRAFHHFTTAKCKIAFHHFTTSK